ncbi:right-handed parallel beta-helix repeat-containing protein [bacterium]|nr:right-handed parallel beta-helix repeat-containing protein [bacterium]
MNEAAIAINRKQTRLSKITIQLIVLLLTLLLSTQMAVPSIKYVAQRSDSLPGSGTSENPFGDLQKAIEQAKDGDVLKLAPGEYLSTPALFHEVLCGNCAEHKTDVQATRGFFIEDKALHIQGAGSDETILITDAGYGVLFLNSRGSTIEDVMVTGGMRDMDGNATDAGIVAKFSTVTIRCCQIRDNTDYNDSVIVGIGGVMGRENSELLIQECRMINNSWDGVALYRGASAVIEDCVIDSGRGAGIGVTWDASATCLRNRVSNYWKGIGSFGTSTVVARNNAVFDNLGWGIIATGASHLIAENNVVTRNGNCGMAIWSAECRGRIVNNIITNNGHRKEWVCPCVGLWSVGKTTYWTIDYNDVWANFLDDFKGPIPVMQMNKNLSANPQFVDSLNFHLAPSSPCIDAGDSQLTDPDGTPSDLGIHGGPAAR